jgi:hypothetical protein
MLRPGDLIPRFDGATVDGREVPYEQLWQHRNVVLFVLSESVSAAARPYLGAMERRLSELKPQDTTLVVLGQRIEGVPLSSVAIADRWGEIVHIQELENDPATWPPIDDIADWVEFIRVKCPECPP